ncbi:hypothetical protein FQA39_LY03244 [Lamprigera yunnana]|nr:hypothetical protein FQA39_LY03244 [Lamprigera yunnana]
MLYITKTRISNLRHNLKNMNSLFKFTKNFNTLKDTIRQCGVLSGVSSPELLLFPHSSHQQTILQVAIIGMPNAGKSTFINNLMDRKVCATSSKVHTTRSKASAIFTEKNSQIIFLDTPGLVTDRIQKRYKLENSFRRDSEICLKASDVIGVIHDVSETWTRDKLDIKIINLLEKHKTKQSFLVLNKVDILKSKRKLLDLTRSLTMNSLDGKEIPGKRFKENSENRGWPFFTEIFMVSALTGDGLDQVKAYLLKSAKLGKWLYPENIWTDQKPEKIITDIVKATLLDFLPQEIPYQLEPELELYEVNDAGMINAVVLVNCVSERVAKLVAGMSDGRLRQITESTQKSLQSVFHHFVRIQIILKAPKK